MLGQRCICSDRTQFFIVSRGIHVFGWISIKMRGFPLSLSFYVHFIFLIHFVPCTTILLRVFFFASVYLFLHCIYLEHVLFQSIYHFLLTVLHNFCLCFSLNVYYQCQWQSKQVANKKPPDLSIEHKYTAQRENDFREQKNRHSCLVYNVYWPVIWVNALLLTLTLSRWLLLSLLLFWSIWNKYNSIEIDNIMFVVQLLLFIG